MGIAVVDRYCRYAVEIAWRNDVYPRQLFIFNLSDNDIPNFILNEFADEGLQKMMDHYAQYKALDFLNSHCALVPNRGNAIVERVLRVDNLIEAQVGEQIVFTIPMHDITPEKKA